jgi:Flp pilus assembly pilin Flp
MLTVLKRLVRDESGQDLAEYGIALAVIAGIVAVGQDVQTLWQRGQNAVSQAVSNP